MKHYVNFEAAVAKLIEFLTDPATTEREQAGIIQAFEFSFEQCWKTWQKEPKALGLSTPSPRQTLAAAFRQGWIVPKKESLWIQMHEDRNLASHTYRAEVATRLFERIQSQYSAELQAALAGMRARQEDVP
jgi:nucleotidyltransferase substrate binding protein (TIGR01987 family)